MNRTITTIKNIRGNVLMMTLVLVAVASFGSLMMSRTVMDQNRQNARRRDLARALYAAEGGVALLQHWSNFPTQYTPNPTLFAQTTQTPNYPYLRAALASGGVTIGEETLAALGETLFTSGYGYQVSRIERLEILPYTSADPILCLFKVNAVGRAASGLRRTVTAYMNSSVALTVKLPAALLSYNVAAAFGNARIHWGQAWSKNTFNMLNKSQMDYVVPGASNYDQWVKYRTEAGINFPTNWQWGEGRDLYDASRVNPGDSPASGHYEHAFEQHLAAGELSWPEFDYQTFKDMALAHGRYYGTDASGNIYRDGIKDSAHRVNFLTEFGVPNRDTAPYDLVFIDTVNALPPAADGSNLATVSVSGNGLGLKGVFWMGANFNGGGVGSPPFILDAENPDGNPPPDGRLSKIFLEGVLYGAGTVEMSGNCGVYGSVVARRGFTGGGTPDVWYNHKLGDEGLQLESGNVGSKFIVAMEKNY